MLWFWTLAIRIQYQLYLLISIISYLFSLFVDCFNCIHVLLNFSFFFCIEIRFSEIGFLLFGTWGSFTTPGWRPMRWNKGWSNLGGKSVFPFFYFGTKSIILQRNCRLKKRKTFYYWIQALRSFYISTKGIKRSWLPAMSGCDESNTIMYVLNIYVRQSCSVFLFYMVQFRNNIAKGRKFLMMMKHWFSWSETCERERTK